MNRDKMIEWIGLHSVGISSKAMWCALMDLPIDQYYGDIPRDRSDLSRCVDLVRYCSITKEDLARMSDKLPYWDPVIRMWDRLVKAYESEESEDIDLDSEEYEIVYDLLHSVRDEVESIKSYLKESKPSHLKKLSTP